MNIIAISNKLYDKTKLVDKGNCILIKDRHELTLENLKKIKPKYIFFPHWSYIIPEEIYNNFNCVIFHMTDLPYGRGGSPLQNLLANGIYKTKISAIKCEKYIDSGEIYLQKDFDISEGSAKEIYLKMGDVISDMITEIIKTNPKTKPQEGKITTFKRRTSEMSNLRNINGLRKVYDYIRMLDADGYPKAFITTNNIKYEFSDATFLENKIIAQVEINEING